MKKLFCVYEFLRSGCKSKFLSQPVLTSEPYPKRKPAKKSEPKNTHVSEVNPFQKDTLFPGMAQTVCLFR